jgi:hypothetical protein
MDVFNKASAPSQFVPDPVPDPEFALINRERDRRQNRHADCIASSGTPEEMEKRTMPWSPPKAKPTARAPVPSQPSGKQLANRVSNTSEEMAEVAWRYALADVNRKAHASSPRRT